MKTYIFIAIVISLALVHCRERCPENLYYELDTFFTPVKDTFEIGDTIRLRISFPDQLIDKYAGIRGNFVDYDFQMSIAMDRIDVYPLESGSIQYLEPLSIEKGEVQNPGPNFVGSYGAVLVYENHRYEFDAQFIIKQKGMFLLAMGLPFWNDYYVESECGRRFANIRPVMNQRGDNNYYMLKYSPASVYQNATKEYFDEGGAYCYYVK